MRMCDWSSDVCSSDLGPDTPIRTLSTLIAPTPDWVARGVWKSEAESVHKIDRGSLHYGQSPSEVVRQLNSIIGFAGIALCDGGKHDRYWLDRLVEASEEPVGFALASWYLITLGYSIEQMKRHCDFHPEMEPPHRAGPDAAINMRSEERRVGKECVGTVRSR